MQLLPDSATKIDADGTTHDVSIAALLPGDHVLVRPGLKVPVDGRIIEGSSGSNEAMLTGESRPVSKTVGATAIGGAVNGANAVTIEVTASQSLQFSPEWMVTVMVVACPHALGLAVPLVVAVSTSLSAGTQQIPTTIGTAPVGFSFVTAPLLNGRAI